VSSGEDSKTLGAGDEAFRPHDVAMMTVACGISMKFGLKSRLPAASKVELLQRPPRIPCPTRHQACCCSLDYTNYSSLPKHILFFFPSTKLIKHSTKTTPNTPHQHFTMATLSCTYKLQPIGARRPCSRELCVCCDMLATASPRVHHGSTTFIA
jgi:hypothetical protein